MCMCSDACSCSYSFDLHTCHWYLLIHELEILLDLAQESASLDKSVSEYSSDRAGVGPNLLGDELSLRLMFTRAGIL